MNIFFTKKHKTQSCRTLYSSIYENMFRKNQTRSFNRDSTISCLRPHILRLNCISNRYLLKKGSILQ